MANELSFPIPIGVTNSFPGLQPNVNSPAFKLDAGDYVITFQPADQNAPGTLTLYDTNANALIALSRGGYGRLSTRGGSGFYFTGTQLTNMAAITKPSAF